MCVILELFEYFQNRIDKPQNQTFPPKLKIMNFSKTDLSYLNLSNEMRCMNMKYIE